MFKKADLTREKLFQVAVELFGRKGFDATTMREIAAEAEVALGATYYHFTSKESLVYEYYKRSQTEHEQVVADFLQKEPDFQKRLHRVITRKIELAEPYKDMARALFRVAADPNSPLSPLSDESQELRLQAVKILQDVVDGSRDKFHPEIKKLLPEYLWLYMLGVILFWLYDKSAKSEKTYEFIDKTTPLIASLNQLILSPMAVPFRKKIISTLKSLAPSLGPENKGEKS